MIGAKELKQSGVFFSFNQSSFLSEFEFLILSALLFRKSANLLRPLLRKVWPFAEAIATPVTKVFFVLLIAS